MPDLYSCYAARVIWGVWETSNHRLCCHDARFPSFISHLILPTQCLSRNDDFYFSFWSYNTVVWILTEEYSVYEHVHQVVRPDVTVLQVRWLMWSLISKWGFYWLETALYGEEVWERTRGYNVLLINVTRLRGWSRFAFTLHILSGLRFVWLTGNTESYCQSRKCISYSGTRNLLCTAFHS